MNPVRVADAVVEAIHDEQLAAHGGLADVRDAGMLASVLAKPLLVACGTRDIAARAATYACGIARNHPFLDGNKRTAFVVSVLFLALNDLASKADDAECVVVMLGVADGSIDEATLGGWFRDHVVPSSDS